MRLDSLYSLLAKKFILTLPTAGLFAINLYAQAAPSSDLLHRLSLHANACLSNNGVPYVTNRWVINHIEFSRFPQMLSNKQNLDLNSIPCKRKILRN